MKVVAIVGARPQFVKASIVSRAFQSIPEINEVLVHTGQHYDSSMSQVFFDELSIPVPVCNLGVGSGTHGRQTGQMLEAIERVLLEHRPDCVLVYGDTNSTLAGALAAVKLHIPLAHVEAGLRSFNRKMPEEINRILTDHASDLLFAPTNLAVKNLLREGLEVEKIREVGDVMYDAAVFYGNQADRSSVILEDLGLKRKAYVLATIHRAENTDSVDRLRAILAALERIVPVLPVILPLHPRTRNVIAEQQDLSKVLSKLTLIDPVGYLDMLMLEKQARIIITDSGGVQKEAFFFSVPCVTVRAETEWQELVDMGWNRLVPLADPDDLAIAVNSALTYIPTSKLNPYGDGRASEKIAESLLELNSKTSRNKFFFQSIQHTVPL